MGQDIFRIFHQSLLLRFHLSRLLHHCLLLLLHLLLLLLHHPLHHGQLRRQVALRPLPSSSARCAEPHHSLRHPREPHLHGRRRPGVLDRHRLLLLLRRRSFVPCRRGSARRRLLVGLLLGSLLRGHDFDLCESARKGGSLGNDRNKKGTRIACADLAPLSCK